LLRAHGLIHKLPNTHRCQVSQKGRFILNAILSARRVIIRQFLAPAAREIFAPLQADGAPLGQKIERGPGRLNRFPSLANRSHQFIYISHSKPEILDPARVNRHDLTATRIHRRQIPAGYDHSGAPGCALNRPITFHPDDPVDYGKMPRQRAV
jgi:hypothetical protein